MARRRLQTFAARPGDRHAGLCGVAPGPLRDHAGARLRIGLSAFALCIAAAALPASDRSSRAPTLATPPATATRLDGRIALTGASVRQAYSAGLIDRPIRSILNVPGRMSYGEFRWDERGVPQGPLWIRVDLSRQIVSVFRAGHEIGTAVVLYGSDGLPTPHGRFPILAKLKDHRSATYDAPMPYTLRLTADGVSIHASAVRWGYATHGCIGVPVDFAARLFAAARVGDQVTIVDRPTKA